jgi:hypothetical protein
LEKDTENNVLIVTKNPEDLLKKGIDLQRSKLDFIGEPQITNGD